MPSLVPRLARVVGGDLILTVIHAASHSICETIHFVEVNNYGPSPDPLSSSTLLQAVAGSHSTSSNHQAVMMIITKPACPNHIDTTSTLIHSLSNDTIVPKGAVPPVGTAAKGLSLWRSILDTHGEGILQCASDQFLDLATALRLESINTRDLVGLLAKAGRLGYGSTSIIEDNAVDEADECSQPRLGANSVSTVPGVGRDQGSDSTASKPSPAEASRGPKRRKKNDGSLRLTGLPRARAHPTRPCPITLEKQSGNNVRQRRGCMRMQDQTHGSAMASGTNVGTILQAEAPCPRSSTAMKRPRFQNGVHPTASSDVKQGTLAQRIDFVVISDTERESSGEDM